MSKSGGRSKELIEKRNDALIERWNYWTNVQRLRLDDALMILSETEFFISEERIMTVIREYGKRELPPRSTVPKVKVPKLNAKTRSILLKNPQKNRNITA